MFLFSGWSSAAFLLGAGFAAFFGAASLGAASVGVASVGAASGGAAWAPFEDSASSLALRLSSARRFASFREAGDGRLRRMRPVDRRGCLVHGRLDHLTDRRR